MSVINTHSFGRFWPVSWTITHCFWSPGVMYTSNEPCGAFTCRSSTLAVLVDSDPFRGLLLTVLGSQIDIHGCLTTRCAYVSVINTHSFGRFWPVSWTIYSLFWGPGVISTSNEPWGAFMCRSSTLTLFADSGPFHGQLLTVFVSQSDLHD